MKKAFLFSLLFLAIHSGLMAQCLSIDNCFFSPLTYCDVSPNDGQLWHDSLFLDPVPAGHDLGETPVDLSFQVDNNCGGEVQAWFVLQLDLNGDGVRETAITSQHLAGGDTIYVGNAANPNFTGGIARHFDTRPVPASGKYTFALEKTVAFNIVTVRLRWVTAAAPTTYLVPQLPYGQHRIDWYFEKDGEIKTCGNPLIIKDCKSPTIVCSNPSTSIPPTQLLTLNATDFLQYAEDNYSSLQQLKYAVRRSGTGTGYPVDGQGLPLTTVTFTCNDLGTQPLELWVMDAAGNADYCEASFLLQDNNFNCTQPNGITLCAFSHCNAVPISNVSFDLAGPSPAIPPFTLFNPTDNTGCVTLDNTFPLPSNATITPIKDENPLNGVSTYDLVLISRHILGLEPLNSPYKMIAADINKNGAITSFDIVELRRLILGVYQELPNNTSWRFVDKDFVFPNPGNPFQTIFPENVSVSNFQGVFSPEFVGVKIGDVNCNALNNLFQAPGEEALTLPNLQLHTNDVAEVPVYFLQANNYYGFQFGLDFDPNKIEVLEVIPEFGTLDDNFGIFPNRINVSRSNFTPFTQLPEVPVYRLRIKALGDVTLADVFKLATNDLHAEAYPTTDSLVGLKLQFATVATTEPEAEKEIFAPQPNPTTAGVRVSFQLEQMEEVKVEILDETGRLVYQLTQNVSAGAQFLEIPPTTFRQNGLYIWRIKAGKLSRSGKLVKQ